MDSTRNIRHAVQALIPLRPAPLGNRRLVRFLALALVSLLIVLLALSLFSAIGTPRSVGIGLAMAWMILVCVGAPVTLYQRMREEKSLTESYREWASDPRRIAIDRLGLDLAAGRLPRGIRLVDIQALESSAADWRGSREALDALSWVKGDLASTRDDLREKVDETMVNLLAEAGSGCALGLSPFALDRARSLFVEIATEANQIAATNVTAHQFPTDASIEAMRPGLERLREARLSLTQGLDASVAVAANEL